MYKNDQYERVNKLMQNSDVFYGDTGNGYFRNKQYPFILSTRTNNIYAPIIKEAIDYFRDNNISWWGGHRPPNHALSSQIACINHLFPIRQDKAAVLDIVKRIRPEITDVLVITTDDANKGYIQFEAVSKIDHLNEMEDSKPTRGSLCTSIDALILGKQSNGRIILIAIEWKYTESYGNENKADGSKGETRKNRYTDLINESTQLSAKTHDLYYFEPFYQLMRQTLWAEQMIKNRDGEDIRADDFLHIHVIPAENYSLLKKVYPCSNKEMEASWRDCLSDNSKYVIVSPSDFLLPIDRVKYKELIGYLGKRYWDEI